MNRDLIRRRKGGDKTRGRQVGRTGEGDITVDVFGLSLQHWRTVRLGADGRGLQITWSWVCDAHHCHRYFVTSLG